jgi:hypothetical protein
LIAREVADLFDVVLVSIMDGKDRGLLQDVEQLDPSVISAHHKLLHSISECKRVYLAMAR